MVASLYGVRQFMDGRYKKIFIPILLLITVIGVIYIAKNTSKDDIDANYKPMVKVENKIYYWSKDLEDISLKDFTLIGEVKKSYNSGLKSIDERSENYSSNVFPTGSKLYLYDKTSIIVVTNSGVSLCVEGE